MKGENQTSVGDEMSTLGEESYHCGFWIEVSVARTQEEMQIVDINGFEKGFCSQLMYIVHIK